MAVLETSEFPGRESMIDCALTLGSGRLDAGRVAVNAVVTAGRVREGTDGRRRAAPTIRDKFYMA